MRIEKGIKFLAAFIFGIAFYFLPSIFCIGIKRNFGMVQNRKHFFDTNAIGFTQTKILRFHAIERNDTNTIVLFDTFFIQLFQRRALNFLSRTTRNLIARRFRA